MPSLFRRKPSDLVADAAADAARPGEAGRTKVTKITTVSSTAGPKAAAGTKASSGAKAGAGTKASAGTKGSTSTPAAAPSPAEPEDTTPRARGYTPSKKDLGQATPKRRAGGRVAEPPPANRREALKRMRAKQRESRLEARAGMMAGKEEYLMPRDKGPERALVRDIVDARRNVASYFMPAALIVVVGASGAMPPVIRLGANLLWLTLAAAVIIDSFLLTRKVRKVITDRFPTSQNRPRKHYGYAIFRSLNFRRMRIPAPRVKLGESY